MAKKYDIIDADGTRLSEDMGWDRLFDRREEAQQEADVIASDCDDMSLPLTVIEIDN